MTMDRDPRRALLARLIGWTDERTVDNALRCLPRDGSAFVAQGCPCSMSKVAASPRNEVAVDRAHRDIQPVCEFLSAYAPACLQEQQQREETTCAHYSQTPRMTDRF